MQIYISKLVIMETAALVIVYELQSEKKYIRQINLNVLRGTYSWDEEDWSLFYEGSEEVISNCHGPDKTCKSTTVY